MPSKHANNNFMIKGEQIYTVDDILFRTTQGFDIFRYYLGSSIRRVMSCPWRKDTHPSWGISNNGTFWYYKDFATEETGNAIHFVEKYFGLSFQDALSKIAYDFGISKVEINAQPVKIVWDKPIDQDYMDIRIFEMPFTKRHHEFWNRAEVTEEHCKKYNCFAASQVSINRKKFFLKKDELCFAYYCSEEDGFKIYLPEREKSERFRNNVSYHHLWNYSNVSECDDLIVQKSMKDLIVTTMINECCIATQAEGIKIFNEEVIEKINKISKSPWIWYGSDWDGVKKCKEITDTNKYKYINTPKILLPEINDSYGYACKYGLKGLEDFMRSKKLIK